MRGVRKLLLELAELALQIEDQRDFRHAWLSTLANQVGFDLATVFSSNDAKNFASYTLNHDPEPMASNLAAYTAELAPKELATAMSGRMMLDQHVFSARRRDRLRVYREVCKPLGLTSSAFRVWMRDGTIFFLFISSSGTPRPFKNKDLLLLDLVFPHIILGETLHARAASRTPLSSLAEIGTIGPVEASVVALAQRGLTNSEIAQLRGTSHHTIRNQLASAYRKLCVSNRTELTYVLSGSEGDWPARRRGAQPPIVQLLAR